MTEALSPRVTIADEVLENLSDRDINELAIFLSDLDTSGTVIEKSESVPASERNTYHSTKSPSEGFDRNKLLNFLDKQAAQYQPKDHYEPYTGEKKGKPWRPKKEVRKYDLRTEQTDKIPTAEDWEMMIDVASEEDIADLAALLGLGHLVNQDQYQAAQKILAEDKKQRAEGKGAISSGLEEQINLRNTGKLDSLTPSKVKSGAVKMDIPLKIGAEINSADIDDVIKRAMDNDQSLTEINLNNIKNISKEKFANLLKALKNNRTAKKVLLANTRMEDCVAFALADVMEGNDVIEVLNVESNFLSGAGGLLRLCEAVEKNTTLKELRVANQFTRAGQAVEMKMAEILQINKTITKFGYNFDAPGPRNIATNAIQRNVEISRKIRRGDVDDSARQPEERAGDERQSAQMNRKKEQMQKILERMIEVEQKEAEQAVAGKKESYKDRMKDMVPRWERLGIPDPRRPHSMDLNEQLAGIMDDDTAGVTSGTGLEDETGSNAPNEDETLGGEEEDDDEDEDDEDEDDEDDDDEDDGGIM